MIIIKFIENIGFKKIENSNYIYVYNDYRIDINDYFTLYVIIDKSMFYSRRLTILNTIISDEKHIIKILNNTFKKEIRKNKIKNLVV